MRTLRRSPGLGVRRIQPRRSSRSSVAVMVAEAIRTRSLTCDGVSGAAAPSMTASAVAAAWGMSKVRAMRRSSSPRRASPVRHRDAYASVQVVSPPGYSSWKSASTLTTPSEAGEGRPPLPGLSGLGSDIREDLDPRCTLHSGLLHPGPQARVVREAGRLLGGREVVGDEQVIAIIGKPHHALRGTAVLGSQRLEFVVDLAPCGVVTNVVPDGKCGAHLVPSLGGGSLPPASNLTLFCLRAKILASELYISVSNH